jgi:hypothetical protein
VKICGDPDGLEKRRVENADIIEGEGKNGYHHPPKQDGDGS